MTPTAVRWAARYLRERARDTAAAQHDLARQRLHERQQRAAQAGRQQRDARGRWVPRKDTKP